MSLSPLEDPDSWMRVGIGPYMLPPLGRISGVAVVKATSAQKTDKKTGAGKNKAKTTKQGTEPSKVTINVRFHARFWALVEPILASIDPNGPDGGGPYQIDHPDCATKKLSKIIVKSIAEVTWERGGFIGNVKIDCEEWSPPAAAAAGDATKTPDKAQKDVGPQWTGGAPKGAEDDRTDKDDPGVTYHRGGPDVPSSKPLT